MDIKTALRRHEQGLRRLPNVTGVGIGERRGKEVLLVFVRRKVPESDLRPEDVVPKRLEGFDTDVEVQISVGTDEGR